MKANRCGKRKPFLIASKLVSVITLIFFSAGTVFALPAGQQVVNGQASFSVQGSNLTITNSPNSIINWQGFSINNNEAVRFIQQYGSSAVLNRVIGQDPSRILGILQSNGRVFLINPNGILFGQGARIDVNGFVGSTLDISNQDFLAGKYNFTAGAIAGSIQNQGTITTPEGGKVYLIAPDIENSGIINSPKGDVILAAGHSVYLVDSLDPDISVVISAPEDKAVNLGQILAQSGKVGIYGGLISQKGIVNADSAIVGENGRIFFKASRDITLDAGSTTSAKGGTIEVFGGMEDGTVRVSGALDASAPNGGDGGFIETSASHVKVDDSARITTLAPYGKTGLWLIDPQDYTIAASGGDITGTALSTNLSSTDVFILSSGGGTAGSGDINVNDAVSWGANTLTLTAARDININAVMTASAGAAASALVMNTATANGSDPGVAGGTVKVGFNPDGTFKGRIDFPGRSGSGFLTINGNPYTVINSLGAEGSATGADLQGMNGNLAGYYALGSNIDASATSGWSGGAFLPVGNLTTNFTGVFDGLGHSITGLTINRPTTDYVGLFGSTGGSATILNVGIMNVNITGDRCVGGLVGVNEGGPISNSYVTGSVSGGISVGGLVGYTDFNENASIDNCYSTGVVTYISGDVGGLVGDHYGGPITNSYSTCSVSGGDEFAYMIGGLVGQLDGMIINSYSTGSVTSLDGEGMGGLVGGIMSGSTIANSYSTGAVIGDWSLGGLVGVNEGNISNSYSTGSVTANQVDSVEVGGLVGYNQGTITNSYSTGAVSGPGSNIGGLVGASLSVGGVINGSYWDTNTSGQSSSAGGTGLTTAQMMTQASYSGWDFPGTWNIVEGSSYPYLAWQFIGTPQIISGMLDVAGAGKTIQTVVDGSLLAAASTGANGFYALSLPDNSVPTGSAFLAYVSGDAVQGASVYLASGGDITNLLISSNYLTVSSSGGIMSNTTLSTAKGVLASGDIPYSVSGTNLTLSPGFGFTTASGTTYNLNGNITTNGAQIYNGPLTLPGNAVLSSGLGNISFYGPVTGTGNFTINSQDIFTQTDPISVTGNLALNATGNIGLNNNLLATGGIEIHADGDVTQYSGNISNTIAGSTTPGSYDINISGQNVKLGSVASQRDIDVTAQSLTVGNIQALGSQGFHVDDEYFTYQLPFSFSFYGTPYSTAYISSNGIITFGTGTYAYSDSTSYLQSYKIIASAWNDWDTRDNTYFTRPLDVYVSSAAGVLAVRWDVARYPETSESAQFETLLYDSGNIKFNYGPASTSFAGDVTIGLSNQSFESTLVSQLMNQPSFSMNYLRSSTFSYSPGSGQYSETLSTGSDWSSTMLGAAGENGTSGITSLGNIALTSAGGIAINGIVDAGVNNLKLEAAGIVSQIQMAPITAGGLEILGAGATYNLTNIDNAITTLAGNTGSIYFTNSTGLDIGTVNTAGFAATGDFTLNSNGAITQSALLQVVGASTFNAGASNDISLTNAGNNFGSVWITSGNNVTLNDINAIDLGASTVSGSLDVAAGGNITQTGALAVAGASTFDAGASNDITLTNAGNSLSSVGITSGKDVSLTNAGALAMNASTVSGTLDVTAGGNITQNGVLAVAGASTFNAGASNDITLANAGNNFGSVGITSGKDVSLRDTDALALNASTVSSSLSATAGGDITLNGLISAGTGVVTLSSGGAIINGMGSLTSISAGSLSADAVNGIGSGDPLMTGVNNLAAQNTTTNNIEIDNTGVLAVSVLSNGGTGDVILQNIGAITTDTSTVTSGGAVSITAHSPLTIGTGGVSAFSDISLEASPSGSIDNLTINGIIESLNGNILLTAGSGILLGPGGDLSAPNGTITQIFGLNGGTFSPVGDLAVIGNQTATGNTLSSLITAMEIIEPDVNGDDENVLGMTDTGTADTGTTDTGTTDTGTTESEAKDDDEKELEKKTVEGGEQTTDEKKSTAVKTYCN